jgi:hypothetical protein
MARLRQREPTVPLATRTRVVVVAEAVERLSRLLPVVPQAGMEASEAEAEGAVA